VSLLNYGMPCFQNEGTFGNIFINFSIEWPESLIQAQINGVQNIFSGPEQQNQNQQILVTLKLDKCLYYLNLRITNKIQ